MKQSIFILILIATLVSCGKGTPDYNKIIETDSELADASDLSKNIKKLITEAEVAVEDTDKAKIYQKISSLYLSKGDYNSTIKNGLKAVRFQPNLSGARAHLGGAYLRLNRLSDAERELSASLEYDEKNEQAQFDLGNLFYLKGRYNDAVRHYTSAIAIDPSNYEYYVNRGNAYVKMRRYREAEADYLKTSEIAKEYAPAYKNLGILYDEFLKRKPEAVKMYRHYLSLSPNTYDRVYVSNWIRALEGK